MTPDDLAALAALADAATPGPWTYDGNPSGWVKAAHGPGVAEKAWIYNPDGTVTSALPNAAFIAAAREAVPALIALVHAKESWIDGAKVDLAALEEEVARLRPMVAANQEIDRRAGMLAGVQAERDAWQSKYLAREEFYGILQREKDEQSAAADANHDAWITAERQRDEAREQLRLANIDFFNARTDAEEWENACRHRESERDGARAESAALREQVAALSARVDPAFRASIGDLVSERDGLLTRLKLLAAERDQTRIERGAAVAAVERVRALCRDSSRYGTGQSYPVVHVNSVLAALAATTEEAGTEPLGPGGITATDAYYETLAAAGWPDEHEREFDADGNES